MKPSLNDLRLEWRGSLVADLCDRLRQGRDPWPWLLQEIKPFEDDPAEKDFIQGVLGVLRPEREYQWA